jgi:hypothetical protein
MFSWPLRIAGWIVGIYALLKLATAAGDVTYTMVFQAWMDSLRNVVDLGFLLTPLKVAIILPVMEMIRSFGWQIPTLQDHWQQVFVLTWLLSAALARNDSLGISTPVAIVAAFIATLAFCVAAGTTPVGSNAVITWPVAGTIAYLTIVALLNRSWLLALLGLALAAFLAALGYFFGTTGEGALSLVTLAVVVGLSGLWFVVIGLLATKGRIRQRLQHPLAKTGLDITAVMLFAFSLATVFADPPLF